MAEYSCFLHPQEKGDSLEALCPVCGMSFGFPLKVPPAQINGKPVIENARRGFYSAVFETHHSRAPDYKFAVKVIPQATYAPVDQGGYGKNFDEEVRLHRELAATGFMPRVQDWGEETLRFGDHEFPCFFIEMEYVEGPTLAERIKASPADPREVAQIAWDLLDFLQAMQQRGAFHNDLHAENIKVKYLQPQEARREAINPCIQVVVLDAGSAGGASKSGPKRLGDIHWVATHILELVDRYERSHKDKDINPGTLRLCSQIRRVAEFYLASDRSRLPQPQDMKSAVQNAYQFGEQPWSQPVRLATLSEHYNAQTLPAWFAPQLLYDPGEKWARLLMRPGPQLLAGMRGCGKTILLRSLEWVARTHQRAGENLETVIKRVREDAFLGLFVSCAALLRSPRPDSLELPTHRLFLAFAREAIRDVHACELTRIGNVNYAALKGFAELIRKVVPWFQFSADFIDVIALERSLSTAIQEPASKLNGASDLSPRVVFDNLAEATRQLVDVWKDKKLLFLLDDVSPRYLPSRDVQEVLSQLCLQSPDFGFKISTETQTLHLNTPGGKSARPGRDYEVFDLGGEVYARLKGRKGAVFIEEVLRRRAAVTVAMNDQRPSDVLGHQDLAKIALKIFERGHSVEPNGEKPVIYWGIEALAGVCVGDIGEVLQIYESILDRAASTPSPVPGEIQHQAMIEFADKKLFSLAGQKEWLYSHAVAFAEASYNELQNSKVSRLRQYNEIFVKIDPLDAADLFPKIIELIDKGVFVFTGGTPRTKTRKALFLQFKFAYRKLLGLTNRIPLSLRDRFELSGKNLKQWLDKPRASLLGPSRKLRPGRRNKVLGSVPPREVFEPGPRSQGESVQQSLFSPPMSVTGTLQGDTSVQTRVLHEVETIAAAKVSEIDVNWSNKHVLGAFGFELRSVGAWRNLLSVGRPAAVTMFQYPNIGLAAKIIEILDSKSIRYSRHQLQGILTSEEAEALIRSCDQRDIVIDTTSLTKALIYTLVLKSLQLREEVWVLHTCASQYFPSDQELEESLNLFKSKQFPAAFRALDGAVAGERGPYRSETVGFQRRDPSQPSVMAALVALKYDRIVRLLEEAPVEEIAAICPIHTAGPEAPRSVAAKYVAEYLVQRYGGTVHEVGSLDHEGAYKVLVNLHRKFALDGGYNFEISLTGSKMHVVGAAMFASIATPASVYYSAPSRYDPEKFTKGTAETRLIHLKRIQTKPSVRA